LQGFISSCLARSHRDVVDFCLVGLCAGADDRQYWCGGIELCMASTADVEHLQTAVSGRSSRCATGGCIPLAAVVILGLNEALTWTIPLLQQPPGFGLPSVVPEIFVALCSDRP